MNVSLNETQPH